MDLLCPDSRVLELFLLGEVAEEDWDELAAHVERCGECTQRLRDLRPIDPLASALHGVKAMPRGPGHLVEQRILQRVLEDLGVPGPEPVSSGALAGPSTMQDEPDARTDPAPDEAAARPRRLGHYRLLHVLGRGGMGVVFLAEDLKLRRPAAVKVMLPALASEPAYRERFLREARSAAMVESEFVVPIYHVDEDRGAPYLAMQLLKGETLEARIRRERVLPVRDVARIGREIALGLAAAHERGLIHRDIKPANVFLESRAAASPGVAQGDGASGRDEAPDCPWRVKILDFGLARVLDGDTQVSQFGPVLGTPAYMAPEQADGGPIDARSDLFSLGCVLYHMATGVAPFKRPTLTATLIALATHDPPPPTALNPTLPADLSDFIMGLLAKEPAGRPTSAHDVAAHLLELEDSDPIASAPSPRRRRGGLVATALFVVGGLAIVSGYIVYVVTDTGTIQINAEDEDVRVRIEQDGRLVTILDPRSKQPCYLNTGTYTVQLGDRRAGLEIALPETFILKRGDHHVVSIRRTRPPAVAEGARLERGDPIQQAHDNLEDADKILGEPTSEIQSGTAGAIYRQYEHGQIIRPPGSRIAFAIHGPIYDAYIALENHGPKLGQPLAGIQTGGRGSQFVRFERGEIILPYRSKRAHALFGPYYKAYIAVPDAGNVFGTPGDAIQDGFAGASYVPFERGVVILPPGSRAAFAMHGPVFQAYVALPDRDVRLGQPRDGIRAGYRGSHFIRFERGEIILPARSDAAYALFGPIYEAYVAVEGAGNVFGAPRGPIQPGYAGASYVPFERGEVILPPRSDRAHAVYGPFYAAYVGVANYAATFGSPTSGVQPGFAGASYVSFERGEIILPPGSTRAHAIYGPFHQAYRRLPRAAVELGQPTGDVHDLDGTRRIDFERGWIEYDGGDRATVRSR